MFNILGIGKNYSIGIDFGTSAIKVVELSYKNKKVYLENYGWIDLGLANPASISRPAVSESQASYNKKIQNFLEKLIKSMRVKSDVAYISLPGFSGLITIIEFPDMGQEEMEEAIQFEARKYIPISLDEVALDWEIIGERLEAPKEGAVGKENEKNKEGEKSRGPIWNRGLENIIKKNSEKSGLSNRKKEILLVAAPKSEVIRCGNIVKGVGLDVKNVELELFSLSRAMVGSDPGNFLIIDIGARITNIILLEKGIIKVNRNIEGGGNEVTNVIADSLNISKQRAEELKKENKDLLNNREMSLVIPVLDMIANEAVRILNTYKEKREGGRVDGVVLSGGSSKLLGLDEYFSQKIGIKTIVGNPWRRVIYSEKLKPFVEKMGASFSVALGLAFRGIEEEIKKG